LRNDGTNNFHFRDNINSRSPLLINQSTGNVGITTASTTNLTAIGSTTLQAFTATISTTTSATTTNLFSTQIVVSSSTSGTDFVVNNGSVGIGTSTPFSGLSLGPRRTIVPTEYVPATTTTITIDWRDGPRQLIQVGTSATTISHTGYVAGMQLLVTICNPQTTAGAITWSGVHWAGNTTPTQTTSAGQCDAWSFYSTQATSTSASSPKVFGTAATSFQ